MIIEMLLTAIYSILSLLTSPISIPNLPNEVHDYIGTLLEYLGTGAAIINNYAPLGYMLILFGIILVVDVAIKLYHFVMWIIRKIPMLSMS